MFQSPQTNGSFFGGHQFTSACLDAALVFRETSPAATHILQKGALNRPCNTTHQNILISAGEHAENCQQLLNETFSYVRLH